MTDRDKYISEIIGSIKDRSATQQIRLELETHIDDRIEYYTDAGYDYDYAEKMALSKMGESDRLGLQLNSLHNYVPLTVSVVVMQILYAVCILTPLAAAIAAINSSFIEFNYTKLMFIQSAAVVLLFTVNYYLSSKLLSKSSFYSLSILTFLDSVIATVSNFLLVMCINALTITDLSAYTDIPHKIAFVLIVHTLIFLCLCWWFQFATVPI